MKVAVVIPCFNVAEHIERAVRSVLAQTHSDLDVVVVDDGSTDGTADVLQQFADERRLRVIQQDRKGAPAARNAGLRATTGEYVQFLDADDELRPEKIARQVVLIDPVHAPALIVGGYVERMEDGSTVDVPCETDDPWMALITGKLGTTSANLWQRKAVLGVGGWDERLASSQDHDLAFKLMQADGAVIADGRNDTSILKREQGSISKQDPLGNWVRYIELRDRVRQHLQAHGPYDHEKRIAAADQLIFGAVRIVSGSDRERGTALYKKYLPAGFEPQVGGAISASYLRLYKLVGFVAAEKAARVLGTLQRGIGIA